MESETAAENIDQTRLRYWGMMFGKYDTDNIVDLEKVQVYTKFKDRDFISSKLIFEGDEIYIIKYGSKMFRLKGDKRAMVRYLATEGLDAFTILRITNACIALVKNEFDSLGIASAFDDRQKRVVVKYNKEGKEIKRMSSAADAARHAGIGFRDMIKLLRKSYGKLGEYYYRYKILGLDHA